MVDEVSYPSEVKVFFERLKGAADTIRDHKGSIRIVSHYDGDGLCAAGIVCKVLRDNGIPFWTTITKSLDSGLVSDFLKEDNEFTMFLDIGSSYVKELEGMQGHVMIVDHHQPIAESKKLALINPYFFGFDGAKEVCAATLAYLLAERVDDRARDLVGVGIAGLLSDRQHLGGIKGLNRMILDEAVRDGRVRIERGLALYGNTVKEGIHMSIEPFFRGLTGRAKDIDRFLEQMGLDPEKRQEDLSLEERRTLASMLIIKLLRQGVLPGFAQDLVIDRYWLVHEDMWGRELAAMINACGRMDHEHVGIAVAMGDAGALEQARGFREEHRHAIKMDLFALEKNGSTEMGNIQYFISKDPSRSGALAGLAMNYLFEQTKPTFALSEKDGSMRVSSRGSYMLIEKGVNLAEACRSAAQAVGGEGGGHPIASGASFPVDRMDDFLKEADRIVGEQLESGPSMDKGTGQI